MQLLERRSSVGEVIASTVELQVHNLAHFADLFQNQTTLPGERPKSEAETAVLEEVCKWLPEYQRSFGATPLVLTPVHFHFMEGEDLTELHRRRLGRNLGTLIMQEQVVLINSRDRHARDDHKDLVELANTISHEGLHFSAFTIMELQPGGSYAVARMGLDNGLRYRVLNEAFVVELQREFAYRYYPEIPILKKELNGKKYGHYAFDHRFEFHEVNTVFGGIPEGCCEYARDGSYKDLRFTIRRTSESTGMSIEEIRQIFGYAYLSGDKSQYLPVLRQMYKHCNRVIRELSKQKGSSLFSLV